MVRALSNSQMYRVRTPPSDLNRSMGLQWSRALSSQCDNPRLRVYAINDTSEVCEERFMGIACDDSGSVQPTLILLGTMLGISRVTPVYWDGLKASLQVPQSVGIAGYVLRCRIRNALEQN